MNITANDPTLHWDIFCQVIDNYGDIGVCWRLASNLAQRGQQVRLWVDDPAALAWMAPQGMRGVEVQTWVTPFSTAHCRPGDVLVEAFGCQVDAQFLALYASNQGDLAGNGMWINLEYLSAEAYAQRCHGLPSPVMAGPGAGMKKFFFYPGFTTATGGLLREPDLLTQQASFDAATWLAQRDVTPNGPSLLSLFCYEPASLGELLQTLANHTQPSTLLITEGRASAAVRTELIRWNALEPQWNLAGKLSLVYLDKLSQSDFDRLLWACDFNFVRGEDSLVRALWAGKPFLWQIYPQDDAAHLVKLDAFLDWLQAPTEVRQLHHWWNQSPVYPDCSKKTPQLLDPELLVLWRACVQNARSRLIDQPDLATQLLNFVTKRH